MAIIQTTLVNSIRDGSLPFFAEHLDVYARLVRDITGYDADPDQYKMLWGGAEIATMLGMAHLSTIQPLTNTQIEYFGEKDHLVAAILADTILFNLDLHTDYLRYENTYLDCATETLVGLIPTMLFFTPSVPVIGGLAVLNYVQCITESPSLEIIATGAQLVISTPTQSPTRIVTTGVEFLYTVKDFIKGDSENAQHND
ncbi:MAG: hypothetical protein K0T99_03335 [Alphaproteobacteria bacterium]|nr:hypothetical protein [Alphaproteobacteria bacterium]